MFRGKIIKLYANDTTKLYNLSHIISNYFIQINRIQKKGIVFNPYIIANSPTYETNYGFVGYTFWGLAPITDHQIEKFINSYHNTENTTFWFNDQYNNKLGWLKNLERNIKHIISSIYQTYSHKQCFFLDQNIQTRNI